MVMHPGGSYAIGILLQYFPIYRINGFTPLRWFTLLMVWWCLSRQFINKQSWLFGIAMALWKTIMICSMAFKWFLADFSAGRARPLHKPAILYSLQGNWRRLLPRWLSTLVKGVTLSITTTSASIWFIPGVVVRGKSIEVPSRQ